MASKRIGLVTGGLLAGALLLGTAGLVAAQDPTATPTPGPTTVSPGGMMGDQMGAGMMGGQMGAGMMGGQMGAGMMGGQMGTMTADQLDQMNALHDQMIENGLCDPAQMQAIHSQLHADR
jgi:hypothetical protein